MPRAPATAASSHRCCLPLAALLLAAHGAALAQPAPAPPSAPSAPLRLRLDRLLSERPPPAQDGATTYARAQTIEGTIDDRVVLEGDAEIRREGTVLRGDRITYTQATDQVHIDGHARAGQAG